MLSHQLGHADYIKITWSKFQKNAYLCTPTMEIFNQKVWGSVQAPLCFKVPQGILMCSQVWEKLIRVSLLKTWVSCLLLSLTAFGKVNHFTFFFFFKQSWNWESVGELLISFIWGWVQIFPAVNQALNLLLKILKGKGCQSRLQEKDSFLHSTLGPCCSRDESWLGNSWMKGLRDAIISKRNTHLVFGFCFWYRGPQSAGISWVMNAAKLFLLC